MQRPNAVLPSLGFRHAVAGPEGPFLPASQNLKGLRCSAHSPKKSSARPMSAG